MQKIFFLRIFLAKDPQGNLFHQGESVQVGFPEAEQLVQEEVEEAQEVTEVPEGAGVEGVLAVKNRYMSQNENLI